MAREWILLQRVLGQHAEAVEAFAHVRHPRCDPDFRACRNRDHRFDRTAAMMSATSSVFASASHRTLVPQGRSISMQDGDRCADIDTLSSSSVTSTGTKTAQEPNFVFQLDIRRGVVTLSQIERVSPTTANTEARDFNDLVYRSIAKIRLVSCDVTTPPNSFFSVIGRLFLLGAIL
jgi:hypothetical protein